MVKLPGTAVWRQLGYALFLTGLISWRNWRSPNTPSPDGSNVQQANLSIKYLAAELDSIPRKPRLGGYDLGQTQSGQVLMDGEFKVVHLSEPRPLLNQRLLSALLPVTKESIEQLDIILSPLLEPGTAIRGVNLLSPEPLRLAVTATLQRVLKSLVGADHPEISVKAFGSTEDGNPSLSMFRLMDRRSVSWALVLDHFGLQGLDKTTRSILMGGILDWRTPYGPNGTPTNSSLDLPPSDIGDWIHVSRSKPLLASHLYPPFVLPLDLLSPNGGPTPGTWTALFKQIALCNSWNASGILVGNPSLRKPDPAVTVPTFRLGISSNNDTTTHQATFTPPNPILASTKLKFDILLSDKKDVKQASPLLCGLLSRGHTMRVLVVDTNLKSTFTAIKRKSRLVTGNGGCTIDFFTVNQYMRRKDILRSIGNEAIYTQASDVVITLKGHQFANFLTENFKSAGSILIELPKDELGYCDWMASLTLDEWQSWHIPRVEISVITRDRPESFSRLLHSLSTAKYFGDSTELRINIEQDCDFDTLNIAKNYTWPHGSLFLHHRVVHAGLLPAVVESWYPRNNDTYGLLLEDDVELSPFFYAWVKMTILRYRYDAQVDRSPNLFGISLYQQKNVELRPEGRIPFNARTLFAQEGFPVPSTPYLSQVPCSWGAIYFPEHWSEFHEYLQQRFSETWISMDDLVVLPAGIRSNHWLRSWKKYFIELAYLRGYVMLYPNYEGFLSLSTNHLEYGAHVKTRSKEKRDLFDQPLFPLPGLNEAGMPGLSGLLDLPGMTLPRYRDLPILNLTGGVTTEEELVRVGRQRHEELSKHRGGPNATVLGDLYEKDE
ncbi:hypothetical protein D9611_006217 [Ephemerocybe angulata]|uniref:Uncharacterized protein n=1 Tax=Ephemerocybe angulata TaxID=980116 RepID=A0A8H5C7P0_9AGAR|nr:hypothetical protein D9611_006217 [Tulosesus angulatus]